MTQFGPQQSVAILALIAPIETKRNPTYLNSLLKSRHMLLEGPAVAGGC
jgi:hypothetical protein